MQIGKTPHLRVSAVPKGRHSVTVFRDKQARGTSSLTWAAVLLFAIPALFEFLPEIVWGSVIGFFGALVGILHPPQNPLWSKLQKLGFALLCSGILCWIAAYIVSRMVGPDTF